MQMFYEGKDITADIEVRKANLNDKACGGELDSLELSLDDSKGLWSQWKPAKNHTIQVKESGFDSGVMYIDEIGQQKGMIILKGLPIKQEAKADNSKAWDNVRFLELAQEMASKHDLQLETYGIDNPLYSRVDQSCQADFLFMAWRCLLEGYSLKIFNGKLIIFGQKYMEEQAPVKTITIDNIDGDFLYKDKSVQIYGACKLSYQGIEYQFTAPSTYGPTLKKTDIPLNSVGEAERFSKGLLRAQNCYEQTMACSLKLDPGLGAGNTVTLSQFGLADGKYIAYQIIHKFTEGKTVLKLRRPLEGY